MLQVLTHQFDQLKEEIIAKEMDLVKESQEKSKINREKALRRLARSRSWAKDEELGWNVATGKHWCYAMLYGCYPTPIITKLGYAGS